MALNNKKNVKPTAIVIQKLGGQLTVKSVQTKRNQSEAFASGYLYLSVFVIMFKNPVLYFDIDYYFISSKLTITLLSFINKQCKIGT